MPNHTSEFLVLCCLQIIGTFRKFNQWLPLEYYRACTVFRRCGPFVTVCFRWSRAACHGRVCAPSPAQLARPRPAGSAPAQVMCLMLRPERSRGHDVTPLTSSRQPDDTRRLVRTAERAGDRRQGIDDFDTRRYRRWAAKTGLRRVTWVRTDGTRQDLLGWERKTGSAWEWGSRLRCRFLRACLDWYAVPHDSSVVRRSWSWNDCAAAPRWLGYDGSFLKRVSAQLTSWRGDATMLHCYIGAWFSR